MRPRLSEHNVPRPVAFPIVSTHQVQCRGDYPADYRALASALGSKRLQPSEQEQRFVAGMAAGRYHSTGSVNVTDIEFLGAVVAATGAARAVESGTASGGSAAVIAAAMARGFEERGEALPGVLLDTIDRKEQCPFDLGKPIGFMVEKITPGLASRVRFHANPDSTKAAASMVLEQRRESGRAGERTGSSRGAASFHDPLIATLEQPSVAKSGAGRIVFHA